MIFLSLGQKYIILFVTVTYKVSGSATDYDRSIRLHQTHRAANHLRFDFHVSSMILFALNVALKTGPFWLEIINMHARGVVDKLNSYQIVRRIVR